MLLPVHMIQKGQHTSNVHAQVPGHVNCHSRLASFHASTCALRKCPEEGAQQVVWAGEQGQAVWAEDHQRVAMGGYSVGERPTALVTSASMAAARIQSAFIAPIAHSFCNAAHLGGSQQAGRRKPIWVSDATWRLMCTQVQGKWATTQ